jgi:hypothetical protein
MLETKLIERIRTIFRKRDTVAERGEGSGSVYLTFNFRSDLE